MGEEVKTSEYDEERVMEWEMDLSEANDSEATATSVDPAASQEVRGRGGAPRDQERGAEDDYAIDERGRVDPRECRKPSPEVSSLPETDAGACMTLLLPVTIAMVMVMGMAIAMARGHGHGHGHGHLSVPMMSMPYPPPLMSMPYPPPMMSGMPHGHMGIPMPNSSATSAYHPYNMLHQRDWPHLAPNDK
ncbi:hypothetical protein glysoja_008839 [Glycine soja]|nr:hypothetical protein glysoja_008839 [Glycine soja]